ncbi:MAG: ribonuclease D [Holosporaceae bacterium]|jgi:ribonuclease D|nr:ribonuclease D [Holosporaceae bacterium]
MIFVDSPESVRNFCKIFADDIAEASEENKFIAVDTEFIRENLSIPLICLVQVATANTVFVIDPLAVDLAFLCSIFEDEKLPKVFHSGQQDIEILKIYGLDVNNICDTQLYEMLLSTRDRISYLDIVKKYLDKNISKSYSTSNWMHRPLNEKQLLYSAEDVLYLRDVYKKQQESLRNSGRLHWLDGEIASFYKKNETSQIKEKKSTLFQQLFCWRSTKAMEISADAQSIASDALLNKISKKGVPFIKVVQNSRWIINNTRREFLQFAELLAQNMEITPTISHKNISVHLLKAILEIKSAENNVAISIIATTAELERLCNGYTDVKCLSGWRNEIFGKYAMSFLRGELAISMKNSNVVLK